jgi:hypothetical protein
MMFRPPAFSGSFYPADPAVLRHDVESLLGHARGPAVEVAALMSPHAGYVYSGRVAGSTYGSALLPPRLILMGPNHTGRGAPLALCDSGEWETPLGRVPIDADLARRLLELCPLLEVDMEAHRREHALEVQLPFLQVRVPGLRIVPLCVGSPRLEDLQALGTALARLADSLPEPFAIIISSDMTHHEPREEAERLDRKAIAALEQVDARELHRVVDSERITMCGVYPAVAALAACRSLGARTGRLVEYATSGDVTGDYGDVVAYAGMHFRRAG